MATVAATNPTIVDIAKMTEPDGGIVTDIGELLSQDNEILLDATFLEANNKTSHRHTQRTGIPAPTWRRYYEGVAPTKSTYAQLDEPIGMMENRSVVDSDLLKHSGNPSQTRLNEAIGILEGFNQDFAQTLLYGSVGTSPARFNGVMGRYSSLSAASGANIISAGGSGSDNASILLMTWSPRHSFCVYPQGSKAGLERQDLGEQQITTADSPPRRYSAFEEIFKQSVGLVVRDWRGNVRIANIDKSLLVAQTNAPALLELMAAAVDKLPSGAMGSRHAFYVPRVVKTMLRIQCMKQANVYLTVGNEEGKPKLTFDGIPIRKVDQMQADEAAVT
jgi:hypothetical protein